MALMDAQVRRETESNVFRERLAAALLGLITIGLTGCSYSLPLGGIAVGRGRPAGQGVLQLGAAMASMPELWGTLPPLYEGDTTGVAPYLRLVNPVPHPDSLVASGFLLLPIGASLGISESVDLGFHSSRGLYSVIRIAHDSSWAVSASPAFFSYSGGSLGTGKARARVRNVNLTGLFSVDPWPGGRLLSEAYTGAGLSRFYGSIDTGLESGSHAGVVATLLAGLRLGGPACLRACESKHGRHFTVGGELQGTWITQRNGRRDFIPTLSVFLSIGWVVPAPPTLRPTGLPQGH